MVLLEHSCHEIDYHSEQLPHCYKNKQEADQANVLEEIHGVVAHPVEVCVDRRCLCEIDAKVIIQISGIEAHNLIEVLHEGHRYLRQVEVENWDM